MISIKIGKNSNNELYAIDICKLPHLFVSYTNDQQLLDFFVTTIQAFSINSTKIKTTLLLSPKNAEYILPQLPQSILGYCHIRNQDEQTGIASKKIFFSSLIKEMKQRLKLFKNTGVKNLKEYNPKFKNKSLHLMVVLIDDTFDLLRPSKTNTGLQLIKVLLAGHAAGIHCITASTISFKNLVRQLVNMDIRPNTAVKKFMDANQLNTLPPLGADLIFTADNLVFIKERDSADYIRLYAL